MTTPTLPSPALPTDVTHAYFQQLLPNNRRGERVDVLFNPASLQYTASNTLKEEGSGGKKKQFVDKSSSKLTMQLVFDTTDTGADVREHTQKMLALLKPIKQGAKQVPPNVEFNWGVYKFTGLVEQYKETLDFFSSQGTPLRAGIDITLSSQDIQFSSSRNPQASVDGQVGAVDVAGGGAPTEPAVVPNPPSAGPAGAANALGDPRAARAIASANGADSLRFGAGAELAIGVGIDLRAEAAFSAGASAGLGIGGGAGIGIGGGIGAGIGGGLSADAGFSAGAGLSAGAVAGFSAGAGFAGAGFSGSAGAGIGAGAGFTAGGSAVASGAFGGLRTTATASVAMPDARASWTSSGSTAAIGSGARFDVGGRAQASTGSGLSADVGASADLNALIRFG